MRIRVMVKQWGSRGPLLAEREMHIPTVASLRELLAALVRAEVEAWNARPAELPDSGEGSPTLLHALTPQQVAAGAAAGKVGFGLRYTAKPVENAEEAVERAVLAFEDGLFRVFCEEAEVRELDAPLMLCEGELLTFFKLTMLAGYR